MSNQESLLFESYKDKANSLQRTIIIFLGIAFFFFFMILIPYYSLKVDTYRLSIIYGLLNNTLQDISYSASAILNQYFENLEQNRNLTQDINRTVNDFKIRVKMIAL